MKVINVFNITSYYNENIYLQPIDKHDMELDGYDCIHYKNGKILQYPFDKPLSEIKLITNKYKIVDKRK